MIRRITSWMSLAALTALAACSSTGQARLQAPTPVTPTEQYALTAESRIEPVHLRTNPNGISSNQARALDHLAHQAAWTSGAPIDVQIVTSPDPAAVASGQRVAAYLMARDVLGETVTQFSSPDQPADVVTVNVIDYRARTYGCGTKWENLAATRKNEVHSNFGCALTSNLAAQVADPRDLVTPATATASDAGRKSDVLGKYRKGEVTASAKDDQSNGAISQAIK